MDSARGAVELVAKVTPLVLMDQRLQHLILGGGRPAHQRAAGRQPGGEKAQKCAAVGAAAGQVWRSGIVVSTIGARPCTQAMHRTARDGNSLANH